jgi:hypothetical protein
MGRLKARPVDSAAVEMVAAAFGHADAELISEALKARGEADQRAADLAYIFDVANQRRHHLLRQTQVTRTAPGRNQP